jgi:hypothetical protein
LGVYCQLIYPTDLVNTASFHVFRNTYRAIYEDEINSKGGFIQVFQKINKINETWERILFDFLGNSYPEDILGVLIRRRNKEFRLSFWCKTSDDQNTIFQNVKFLSEKIELGLNETIEFHSHDRKKVFYFSKTEKGIESIPPPQQL